MRVSIRDHPFVFTDYVRPMPSLSEMEGLRGLCLSPYIAERHKRLDQEWSLRYNMKETVVLIPIRLNHSHK